MEAEYLLVGFLYVETCQGETEFPEGEEMKEKSKAGVRGGRSRTNLSLYEERFQLPQLGYNVLRKRRMTQPTSSRPQQ